MKNEIREIYTTEEMEKIIRQSKSQFMEGRKLPARQFCDEKFTNSLMKFFDIKPFTLKDCFIEILHGYKENRSEGVRLSNDFLESLTLYLRNSQ